MTEQDKLVRLPCGLIISLKTIGEVSEIVEMNSKNFCFYLIMLQQGEYTSNSAEFKTKEEAETFRNLIIKNIGVIINE